jgi:hypothetical protein
MICSSYDETKGLRMSSISAPLFITVQVEHNPSKRKRKQNKRGE